MTEDSYSEMRRRLITLADEQRREAEAKRARELENILKNQNPGIPGFSAIPGPLTGAPNYAPSPPPAQEKKQDPKKAVVFDMRKNARERERKELFKAVAIALISNEGIGPPPEKIAAIADGILREAEVYSKRGE